MLLLVLLLVLVLVLLLLLLDDGATGLSLQAQSGCCCRYC
jgi:hypothetical protein